MKPLTIARPRVTLLLLLLVVTGGTGWLAWGPMPPALAAQRTAAVSRFRPAPTSTPTPACKDLASSYRSRFDALVADWDDANALAGQTGKIALAPQVSQLQAIRRDVNDLSHPSCVDELHSHITQYMDEVIDGYLTFMGSKYPGESSAYFAASAELLDRVGRDLTDLDAGRTPGAATSSERTVRVEYRITTQHSSYSIAYMTNNGAVEHDLYAQGPSAIMAMAPAGTHVFITVQGKFPSDAGCEIWAGDQRLDVQYAPREPQYDEYNPALSGVTCSGLVPSQGKTSL